MTHQPLIKQMLAEEETIHVLISFFQKWYKLTHPISYAELKSEEILGNAVDTIV